MYIINIIWLLIFCGCFHWGYKFEKLSTPPKKRWVLLSVPAILASVFTSLILLINAKAFHLTGIGVGGVGANLLVYALFTAGLVPAILGWLFWVSGKVCKIYMMQQKSI
jgi:hypothetical protein